MFFKVENNGYRKYHYGFLIDVIKNDMMHLHMLNYHIETLLEKSGDLSIFMTCLPLVLNLSWWTNIITLSLAVSTKIFIKNKNIVSLNTLVNINFISIIILLGIHLIR
jgi:hypothetical protein